MGVGLLLAASLLILAGASTETSPATGARPSVVQAVYPQENAVIRGQETVGVDVRDDYTAIIIVDGNRIPEDQYSGDPNLGIVQWRPGADREFDEFDEGTHTIEVEYWPAELSEEEARAQRKTGVYGWRFRVG